MAAYPRKIEYRTAKSISAVSQPWSILLSNLSVQRITAMTAREAQLSANSTELNTEFYLPLILLHPFIKKRN